MSISLPGLEVPSVQRHGIVAGFDGGDVSGDGRVMLVSQADQALGLTSSMAAVVPHTRQSSKIRYDFERIIAERVYGIACAYEDGKDNDTLRNDPQFKLACFRLPLEREVPAAPVYLVPTTPNPGGLIGPGPTPNAVKDPVGVPARIPIRVGVPEFAPL